MLVSREQVLELFTIAASEPRLQSAFRILYSAEEDADSTNCLGARGSYYLLVNCIYQPDICSLSRVILILTCWKVQLVRALGP